MSAAEPVRPTPAVNGQGEAAVIDFRKHGGSRSSGTGPGGRWHRDVNNSHANSAHQSSARTMHDLAEHVEITFNAHRLSLTDVRTARAYDTTLQIVTGMLEGAHAEGIIDEAQRGKLGELFQGMRQAPEIIAEE